MKDVPGDYYARLHAAEERSWWHAGMRSITGALLGDVLERGHASLLDAGCGTGGFLAWASSTGAFDRLCGIDISAEAVELGDMPEVYRLRTTSNPMRVMPETRR